MRKEGGPGSPSKVRYGHRAKPRFASRRLAGIKPRFGLAGALDGPRFGNLLHTYADSVPPDERAHLPAGLPQVGVPVH